MNVACISCGEDASRGPNGSYLSTGPGEAYCNHCWAVRWHEIAMAEIGAISMGYESEPDASPDGLFDKPTRDFDDSGQYRFWRLRCDVCNKALGTHDEPNSCARCHPSDSGRWCSRCRDDTAATGRILCAMCQFEHDRIAR